MSTLLDEPIIHLLRRASQAADALFTKGMVDSELSPRQWIVLNAIAQSDRPNQMMISQMTGIDRSTTSDVLKRLHDAALVKRHRNRRDTRAHVLSLTNEGRSTLEKGRLVAEEIDRLLLTQLGGPQVRSIADVVKVLAGSTDWAVVEQQTPRNRPSA